MKKKLKSLRTSYTRQLNELRRERADRVPLESRKPRWKWFHLLDPFLRPYCSCRKMMASRVGILVDDRKMMASRVRVLVED